jgi:hypothetical protein
MLWKYRPKKNDYSHKDASERRFLEDLSHDRERYFRIVRGYGLEGARDYTIQPFTGKLFNERLKYRTEKNHLEAIYKILLNSLYRMTVERQIVNFIKVYDEESEFKHK